jgi:uncharacterized repeat protein (TIGR01451 family)
MKKTPSVKFRRSPALLAVLALALLLAAVLAPGAQARTESFQGLASSPVELTAVAADPSSGLVYAQENEGTRFFAYDPRTDAWSGRAEAPVNSGNNGGAVYLGGKIYVSYTGGEEIAVYDIATDSWTSFMSPIEEEEGSGDIAAVSGQLYLVAGKEFIRYDPATGTAVPLADPPSFTENEEGNCGEGFEGWGGLQYDGAGKIYGHQGNGCYGFAVYDIAANGWTELTPIPGSENEGGGVLGSAFDPVTNAYITYGGYEGHNLYRYDIDSGSWTTATLPFPEVGDGGMAYLALPGYEGVYMVQGEEGRTGFARYSEQNQTDVAAAMSAAVADTRTGGEITYAIQVANNGPERAGGIVLSDPLPAGAKLVSATASQGTCTAAAAVACSLGALRPGQVATLTLKLASGFGKVTNTATVASKAIDTNPANANATVVSSVPACVVPKLRGKSLRKAKKELRKAHCKLGKVKRRHSGKVQMSKVISFPKRRGKPLPVGTKVKLAVSQGPKHKTHHEPHAK